MDAHCSAFTIYDIKFRYHMHYFNHSVSKERQTCPRCLLAIGSTFTAVMLLTLLVIISWWLADLVIFGRQNSRPDGRGCPLFRPPISADDYYY